MQLLNCYYCSFLSRFFVDYQEHVEKEHPSKPLFPTTSYIKKHGLKSHDPFWENLADMEGYEKLFTLKQ